MSLRSAFKYLTVIVVLLIVLAYVLSVLCQMKDKTIDLNGGFFGLGVLILAYSWTGVTFLYYNSLFQHKKRQIINWLESI